jgi:hypothetical protein
MPGSIVVSLRVDDEVIVRRAQATSTGSKDA